MTLAIILFVMVLLGILMFGYALNRERNEREDAMKSGKKDENEKLDI